MSNVGFYVTVVDTDTRKQKVGFVLGPYDTHEEAEGNVDRAKAVARRIDPWSHFYAWGTARAETPDGVPLRPGNANDLIGLAPKEAS